MVRRKPVEPSPEELDQQPPRELLRFRPSQTPPTNAEGRPMPWAVKWQPEEFAAWLRTRIAWRDTHSEPLPGLPAQERCAITRLGIPQALIDAESTAPSRPPEWYAEHPRRAAPESAAGRKS
jgi:hypothetical protein